MVPKKLSRELGLLSPPSSSKHPKVSVETMWRLDLHSQPPVTRLIPPLCCGIVRGSLERLKLSLSLSGHKSPFYGISGAHVDRSRKAFLGLHARAVSLDT